MKISIKLDITKVRKRSFPSGFAMTTKKGKRGYVRKRKNNRKWEDE